MTRLKALELFGFKSFADRTRFEFPDGITVVVGPNGSGKSNVVDAIKWVLGEQSVRSLRGKEMTDVIFAGSVSRKPLGSAETTLVFDNADRRLPVEADEVQIGRRVYRSGESEYLINGEVCRLKDVRELFTGTGAANVASFGQELIVHAVGSTNLTVNPNLYTSSSLTKSGTGTLTLGGTSYVTGNTYVEAGKVVLNAGQNTLNSLLLSRYLA